MGTEETAARNEAVSSALRSPQCVDDRSRRRSRWQRVELGLVPLLLLLGAVKNLDSERSGEDLIARPAFQPAKHFRTVVFILDSAGKDQAFDPNLMPFVSSLRASSLSGRSRACAAKATFPCIKSIFEGREATMGTTLQDFSAFASSRTTWPTSLAASGLRLVVASDHTLNRLYPHAFVDSLNYEDLHQVPLLKRDGFVYRKARQWLDDSTNDVFVLHIVGTDKVSHEYAVGGSEYLEKYHEVDDFVREVAGRLQPEDYLYVISDHGHNELGGHTEDAAYLAHGPLFPSGVQQDLNAEDMLFLLSLPYGLTLPAGYEGQVRIDLTRLSPEVSGKWLTAQARVVKVPIADLRTDAAQALLNGRIVQNRTEGQRVTALNVLWRSLPFWFAAAFFLASQLSVKDLEDKRWRTSRLQLPLLALGLVLVLLGIAVAAWLLAAATFMRLIEQFGVVNSVAWLLALGLLGGAVFWLFPASLTWIHDEAHRPLGYVAFYVMAFGLGLALARFRGLKSWRAQVVEMLWAGSVAIWLFGYFGPLGYSLNRHGSLLSLAVLPTLAILVAGRFRTFFSVPALFLPGLLPLIYYDVESFNLKYLLLDRIPELPITVRAVLCVGVSILFVIALHSASAEPGLRIGSRSRATSAGPDSLLQVLRTAPAESKLVSLLLVSLWLTVGCILFQFDLSKMIGALLACVWFAGCLELFQRAHLPLRWFAMLSAVFLFLLLTCFLNGFALSHVDFRFAADKIVPVAKEIWRAPQLIFWALVKYAFALLPALAVLRASTVGRDVWAELLLLGWWRELTIVAAALGLAVFNDRGMRDLCSEEIYFWTFLNLVLFAACLILSAREGSLEATETVSVPVQIESPQR